MDPVGELAQKEDRSCRVRAALYVYASVGIKKLPAWRNLGDIAVRTGFFGFTKDQPKSCLESLEELNACHKTRNAQFELNHSTAQVFNDRLQRLDPHAEPFILPEGQFLLSRLVSQCGKLLMRKMPNFGTETLTGDS